MARADTTSLAQKEDQNVNLTETRKDSCEYYAYTGLNLIEVMMRK